MAGQQQPQPSAGGGGSQDNSLDLMWGIGAVVVVIALLWYFYSDYIVAMIFHIRIIEIDIVDFFLEGWVRVAHSVGWAHLPVPDTDKLHAWVAFMKSSHEHINFENLYTLSTQIGHYYNIPVAILLAALSVLIFFKHVTLKFKTDFTEKMHKFREYEQDNWPQISPVVNVDLIKEEITKGPWAMSLTPITFCEQYDLIEPQKDPRALTARLRVSPATRVFALQLGPLWRSCRALPIHRRAIFAGLAARANQDSQATLTLFQAIAKSAQTGQLDFSGADQLLAKYGESPLVKEVCGRHAYVTTVMASMLELARTDGVQATSDFLWLKIVDRQLWYILNTLGRQTAFPEVAGIYAHLLAERRLQRPLQVPVVDQAVEGLKVALSDIIYQPSKR